MSHLVRRGFVLVEVVHEDYTTALFGDLSHHVVNRTAVPAILAVDRPPAQFDPRGGGGDKAREGHFAKRRAKVASGTTCLVYGLHTRHHVAVERQRVRFPRIGVGYGMASNEVTFGHGAAYDVWGGHRAAAQRKKRGMHAFAREQVKQLWRQFATWPIVIGQRNGAFGAAHLCQAAFSDTPECIWHQEPADKKEQKGPDNVAVHVVKARNTACGYLGL